MYSGIVNKAALRENITYELPDSTSARERLGTSTISSNDLLPGTVCLDKRRYDSSLNGQLLEHGEE